MTSSISVHFTDIEKHVSNYIQSKNVEYVVGCIAWFSNVRIISALRQKTGVSIITSDKNHEVNISDYYREQFNDFSRIGLWPRVAETLSPRGGKNIMHHKFMAAFGRDLTPLWVITGSCNFTQNSRNNAENIVIIYDANIVLKYYNQFVTLLQTSIPVVT